MPQGRFSLAEIDPPAAAPPVMGRFGAGDVDEAPAAPMPLPARALMPGLTPSLITDTAPRPATPARGTGYRGAQPRRGGDIELPVPFDESAFRGWYAGMAQQHDLDPDPDSVDQYYDYRAAFKAGAEPDQTGHWPSDFKKAGHPNMVVGGFNVQTGERVRGVPRAKDAAELVRLGWDPQTAAKLAATPEPVETSLLDRATDVGVSAAKGIVGIGQSAVGLLDMVSGGRAGKLIDEHGILPGPKAVQTALDTRYSDAQKRAFKAVDDADGLVDTAVAALTHPSVIAHTVVQSAPLMLGGAGVARGAMGVLPKLSALAAGAIGEGVVAAGSAAEQTRQASPDGLLTPKQSGLALASGVTTGAIGVFGGKLAQRLGIADVETMLAGAAKNQEAGRSLARQMIYGAAQEGFLEELPQSVQEQVLQNAAQRRPLDEGVASAAVLGALSGVVTGGGTQGVDRISPAAAAPQGRFTAVDVDPAPTVPQAVAEPVKPAPAAVVATEASPRPTVRRAPNLEPEAAAVQERAARALEADFDGYVQRYQARFGTVINADNASELFDEYAASPEARATNVTAVRGPAATLTDAVYARALATPVPAGKTPVVLFTSGGNGSGKSSAVANVPGAAIVFDSTLTLPEPSRAKIDQALAAGFDVWLAHVHRDPVASFVNGVLPRAMREASGRTVPIKVMARSHANARRVFLDLAAAYRDNPRVHVRAFENHEGTGLMPVTLDALARQAYPKGDDLEARFRAALDAEYRAGRVSDAVYRGTAGAGAAGVGGGDRPDVRRDGGGIPPAMGRGVPAGESAVGREVPHEVPPEVDTLDTGEQQPRLPEAGVVRDQNIATPKIDAPFSLEREAGTPPAGVQRGMFSGDEIDTTQAQEQTSRHESQPGYEEGAGDGEAGREPDRGVAESHATRSESPRQRAARRTEHYAQVFSYVLERAQEVDPSVDPVDLRAEFDDRIAKIEELDTLRAESGHDPHDLLRAVAQYGGLWFEKNTGGFRGEIAWLKEGNRFGTVAGVGGVFRKGGLTPDGMVEALQQDQRFSWIEDINDLLDAMNDAVRAGDAAVGTVYPGTGELATRAEMRRGEAWWRDSWRGPAVEQADDEGDAADDAGDDADISFDPDTFESPMPGGGGRGTSASAFPSAPLPRSRGAPARVTPRLRPSAIIEQVRKGLGGLPVRIGRFRQRAFGIYKSPIRSIRLKVANDLQTFFHEAGHDIDIAVLGINRKDPQWRDELTALGQPTSRPSYTKDQQRKEGAAEFMRRYIMEPHQIAGLAPKYFAEFERRLAEVPALRAVLHQAREDVQNLISQEPATRGRLKVDRSKEPSALSKAADDPRGTLRNAAAAVVDDLAWLRAAVEEMSDGARVAARKNAYVLARLARGAAGKAEAFLEIGVRGAGGRFIGGSLADAIAPVRAHMDAFGEYLVALRAVELLTSRQINPGLTLDEARAIVKETEARDDFAAFEKARDAVYAYQDAILEYAKLYGAFNADQLAKIRKLNQAYVPLQRVFDAADAALAEGMSRRIANRTSPLKRIHGSGREIIDPFESIVGNTFRVIDMVEKNRAMQALVLQAEKAAGSAKWIERIPDPQVATRFNLAQVSRQIAGALEGAGLDDLVPNNLGEALDSMVTVFTPATFVKGNDQVVTVIRNGERQFWQVNNTPLYDAITAIGPRDTSRLVQWLEAPAKILRATATTTPGFILRNPGRDSVVAFLQSRYGFVPVYDTLRGLIAQVRGDKDAKLFFTAGVGQAALQAQDRKGRQWVVKKISQNKADFVRYTVTHPLELLRAVGGQLEVATRLGEFKLALDAGGVERGVLTRMFNARRPRPRVTEESVVRATLAARDVTTDFSRGGTLTKEITRYEAFFNARVQGYARMAEAVRRDPVGVLLKLGSLALFSAALWFLNEDDDKYHELEEWEKHTYWHLKLPGAERFIRIPKPFEWGYVPDVVEAALTYMRQGDAVRFREMREALVGTRPEQIVINLLPTAILPLVEWWANYSAFRDTQIVRAWDLDLPTDLQYSEWTSETAKKLGTVIPIAPVHLDNLIFGYTAGFGRGVVSAIDEGLRTVGAAPRRRQASTPSQQWPVVGNFIRDRSFGASSQSIQDLYDLAEAIATVDAGIEADVKRGDTPAARARVERARRELPWSRRGEILEARRALKALAPDIRQIYSAPPNVMTPSRKRELLDRSYERMVAIARHGLGRAPLRQRAAAGQ